MKQLILAFTCSFLSSGLLNAQKEIISVATEFIIHDKVDGANGFLDSILSEQPKNVDALMMKGNVILNHALFFKQNTRYWPEVDASIFETSDYKRPKFLADSIVLQIESYWKKCLQIDPGRVDVRKGLCTVYSIALMKDSLHSEMARLMKMLQNNGAQAYEIANYAREFIRANKFDDAIELYQLIAKYFPNEAGLRCDIASEYFYKGKMKDALDWLDSCFNFKEVDETSFLNGAFVYSELGYYDNAQSVLNTYSRIYQRKMDLFYTGLRLFADSSDKCVEVLTEFCNSVDTFAYLNEFLLAQKLIVFQHCFSFSTYQALIDMTPVHYVALIHQRAMRQFSTCEPFLMYGTYQNEIKNYSAAVQLLEDINNCATVSGKLDWWRLNYGYALFMTGEQEKALGQFQLLYNSKGLFNREAARYFSAKIFIAKNLPEEAKRNLEAIISSKESLDNSQTSKGYFDLARQLFGQIK